MGVKLFKVLDKDKVHYGYYMKCPGCGFGHVYWTERPQSNGAQWTFNGDMEKPTFKASMLARATPPYPDGERVCHFFVTDGKIEYLGDCTHHLAGQTIEMVDINDD